MENVRELIDEFLNEYFYRKHTLYFEDENVYIFESAFKFVKVNKCSLDMYYTFEVELSESTKWHFDFNLTTHIKGEQDNDDYGESWS